MHYPISLTSILLKASVLVALLLGLSACGGGGGGDKDTSVQNEVVNTPPRANAGTDQSIATGSAVTLTSAASNDVDGDALTYAWSVQSKPTGSGMNLSDSTAVSPTFTADLDGTYVFNLVVNDGTVDSVVDSVTITAASATTTTVKLNDTGITWGGNYPSGNNTTCIGETIAEQDCSQGRDAQAAAGTLTKIGAGQAGFDFTKLDASGNTLPATATSWSCVKDNHTGLVWEVKTTTAGIHNKNNTYHWGGKTAQIATGQTFGTVYNDWDTLVDGSNTEALCGFSDWRVPAKPELHSIVNYNQSNPAIDLAYFPNTLINYYWSASPYAGYSGNAWDVDFYYGGVNVGYRYRTSRVRLVRSGQ